ncbi:MAG TPA: OmpA family protein [Terriglobales bacterium]|nr:OmpA family protein [Terriglobales bacterium]
MGLEEERREAEEGRHGEIEGNSLAKIGVALGVLALGVSLGIGIAVLRSERRVEREMARVSQQAAQAQQQSQTLAQQASQAAASAQTAAQQRDLAKEAQAESDAQAQSAIEQAAAAQQKAQQATEEAEEYRKQREAELTQLQAALGQIADTKRTAIGLVMTLDSKSIRFDFNKAEIKPQYREILNRVAGILLAFKGFTISVYGYTDDIGTQGYNLKLSERRASAVRDFLVGAGIPKTIIKTKGFGKADPRVQGDSEEARAANRRVEIGIVDSTLLPSGAIAVPE